MPPYDRPFAAVDTANASIFAVVDAAPPASVWRPFILGDSNLFFTRQRFT